MFTGIVAAQYVAQSVIADDGRATIEAYSGCDEKTPLDRLSTTNVLNAMEAIETFAERYGACVRHIDFYPDYHEVEILMY